MYEGSLCAILEGDEDVNEQAIIQMACLSNDERETKETGATA
jgi:hypothetical protein